MLHLKRLCVRDFVHSSFPAHTTEPASHSTTSVSVPVLRVVCTGGFRGTHDAGEEADKDYANGGKASADDAHVDLDGRPGDYINLIPSRVDGGSKADKGMKAKARHNCYATEY
jgi:hypothetical protein